MMTVCVCYVDSSHFDHDNFLASSNISSFFGWEQKSLLVRSHGENNGSVFWDILRMALNGFLWSKKKKIYGGFFCVGLKWFFDDANFFLSKNSTENSQKYFLQNSKNKFTNIHQNFYISKKFNSNNKKITLMWKNLKSEFLMIMIIIRKMPLRSRF